MWRLTRFDISEETTRKLNAGFNQPLRHSSVLKKENNGFKILEAPVSSEEGPKIAWLMTFPGAGTTYTTFLVKQASNTTSATNYGNEYLNENKESVPLYSDVSGPYLWQDENIQGTKQCDTTTKSRYSV